MSAEHPAVVLEMVVCYDREQRILSCDVYAVQVVLLKVGMGVMDVKAEKVVVDVRWTVMEVAWSREGMASFWRGRRYEGTMREKALRVSQGRSGK